MKQNLAFVIITPYTIRKSRTGSVLRRLLGNMSGSLIGAQVIALDDEMAKSYADSINTSGNVDERRHRKLIREYILQNFAPTEGRRHRALMLVFAGDHVHEEIMRETGTFISSESGETIRSAFGDEVLNSDGSVRYFEPAVLYSEASDNPLALWEDFLKRYPNLVERSVVYSHPEKVQRTLVLIKPDSFRQGSGRPGAIIDMFSRTGLRIIGCKLINMSVAQAMEFYGPVEGALVQKLAPKIGKQAKEVLEKEFEISLPDSAEGALAANVGVPFAREQFERIINFMTGLRPSEQPREDWHQDGKASCLALVYEGEDAVKKIRDVLGPTDPSKAHISTVRGEFGHDVMVNTAHASDSPENAAREMKILRLNEPSLLEQVAKVARG